MFGRLEKRSHLGWLVSMIVAFLLLLLTVQGLAAQADRILAENLTGSTKSVDKDEALPGDELQYSIVLNNSGNSPASSVVVTDELPAEVAYQIGSLSVTGGGNFGYENGVVTWTGAVNNGAEIQISYSAVLSEMLGAGLEISNTVVISSLEVLLSRSAQTTIISYTDYFAYLPLVYKPVPSPILVSISHPNANNEWTVNWTYSGQIESFELQEARSSAFDSVTSYNISAPSQSKLISHMPNATNNEYYYRVRAIANGMYSTWSNVHKVIGGYRDEMSSSSTGWAIRRQDTDDINNSSWYEGGSFILRIGGRWDYAIASSMVAAPEPPYRISSRISLWEPDNLNSYGLVFGGDWNGQTCPVSNYSTCFNHYYRLQVIWFSDGGQALRFKLKRIDYHDPEDNSGGGITLIPYQDVFAANPSGFNEWSIEVNETGLIRVYLNDGLVGQAVDTNYIHHPYFGVFAATDEYLGARPLVDWYEVKGID